MELPRSCLLRFEPVRTLGEGTFGVVWLARQRSLDRPVAVKVLRESMVEDPAMRARFEGEARATARLDHPAVVSLIDFEAGNPPWIAYEYVPGRNLAEVVATAPMTPTAAVKAAVQIAAALEAAHAMGLVHRDIKPANVLEAEPGRYKVADFGLARFLDDAVSLTATGRLVGSPAFLPPETAHDASARPALDLYALGVTLHQLFTAELPAFEVRTSGKLDARHAAALPRHLVPIVERMLKPDPGARYLTATDVLAALRGTVEGSGVVLRRTGELATPRTRMRSQGTPTPVALPAQPPRVSMVPAAVAGALALLATGWATSGRREPARPAPTPAPVRSASAAAPEAALDELFDAAALHWSEVRVQLDRALKKRDVAPGLSLTRFDDPAAQVARIDRGFRLLGQLLRQLDAHPAAADRWLILLERMLDDAYNGLRGLHQAEGLKDPQRISAHVRAVAAPPRGATPLRSALAALILARERLLMTVTAEAWSEVVDALQQFRTELLRAPFPPADRRRLAADASVALRIVAHLQHGAGRAGGEPLRVATALLVELALQLPGALADRPGSSTDRRERQDRDGRVQNLARAFIDALRSVYLEPGSRSALQRAAPQIAALLPDPALAGPLAADLRAALAQLSNTSPASPHR